MDPSIRSHDATFEQIIALLGITAVVVILCGLAIAYMIRKGRRY